MEILVRPEAGNIHEDFEDSVVSTYDRHEDKGHLLDPEAFVSWVEVRLASQVQLLREVGDNRSVSPHACQLKGVHAVCLKHLTLVRALNLEPYACLVFVATESLNHAPREVVFLEIAVLFYLTEVARVNRLKQLNHIFFNLRSLACHLCEILSKLLVG